MNGKGASEQSTCGQRATSCAGDVEGAAGDEVAGGGVVLSVCTGFACVWNDAFVKLATFCGACFSLYSRICLRAEVFSGMVPW